jgi:hypothetical protein
MSDRTRRTTRPFERAERPRRRAGSAALVAGAVLLSACDPGSLSQPAVSAECRSIGAQCQLPGGPLGVCEQVPCGPGAEPPCFKCASQH